MSRSFRLTVRVHGTKAAPARIWVPCTGATVRIVALCRSVCLKPPRTTTNGNKLEDVFEFMFLYERAFRSLKD